MKATDITVEQFLKSCKNVVDRARTKGWRYGNSTATLPCSDGIISCDRLIARALYDLGFTDQRRGGETCGSLERYLLDHGFKRSFSFSDIKRGSILLVKHAGHTYWDHAFVALNFNPKTYVTCRYDTGSNERIQSVQPLMNVSWGYRKDVIGVFNIPEPPKPIEPQAHKLTQKGQKYLREFMGTGSSPKADGYFDAEWKALYKKAIQAALNDDFDAGLKVDGKYGDVTRAAVDKYCTNKLKHGKTLEMVSMLEAGFYLNNIDPGGYELPGHFGDGLLKAVNELKEKIGKTSWSAIFKKLANG